MKTRAERQLFASLGIILPGTLGLAVVGRAIDSYWQRDRLALTIVIVIGLALIAGLLELLVRQRRVIQLSRELAGLHPSPSEATIDGASPMLSTMLRARVEHAGAPGFGESIAPFLTGLLVMLGLLGTLLGLFETVHGAGRALVSSGDVEALRRSLTTPIEGLTRSFGCSAAGISASVMLGLAYALSRRREQRVLGAIQAYALGPLRALSPTRRQARALEQLTSQGLALPQAASALEQVGKQLESLAARLVDGHDAALAAQARVLEGIGAQLIAAQETTTAAQGRTLNLLSGQLGAQQEAALSSQERLFENLCETLISKQDKALAAQERALELLLGGVREALERSAAQAGEALHARLAPLVHDATERTSDALARQAAALAEATRTVGAQLSTDASARAAEATALVDALRARLDEAERARSAAHQAELDQLSELARRPLAESEAREQAIAERSAALLAQLSESVRLLREAESQQESRLSSLSEKLGAELGTLAESLRAQTVQRLETERAHDERARLAMERLAASATMLDESCGRQSEAIETLVTRVPPLLSDTANAAQKSAQDALNKLIATTDARLGRMAELLAGERDAQVAREKTELERSRSALAQLEQSASLLELSMGRQGEVMEALVARIGRLFEEHATATQQSAEATLQQLVASAAAQAARFGEQAAETQHNAEATLALMAESAEAQAARFAALEASLADNRAAHTQRIAAQLTEHAALLDQKLNQTVDAVREASGTFQAASCEMQAVAELFAKSIERQREASDAWLESLGEVEGAVEQAGRSAAADALSDQLASTQEVFARQLQFQRELFDQLRALRGGGHAGTRAQGGEHDVSV